jgi:hypothetical protein
MLKEAIQAGGEKQFYYLLPRFTVTAISQLLYDVRNAATGCV